MEKIKPHFFKTQADFRKWLEKNHKSKTELMVGYYKVDSGLPSMTWSESVDQALCFGWIDGVRRSIDDKSYCIRFTPRKPTSIWSAINIKKIEELTDKGLMKPEGLAIFQKRKEHKSRIYSHENDTPMLSPVFEKKFKLNKKAWIFFKAQAPSYQKVMVHWIMSAKQEVTRLSRLDKTIIHSQAQKRVP